LTIAFTATADKRCNGVGHGRGEMTKCDDDCKDGTPTAPPQPAAFDCSRSTHSLAFRDMSVRQIQGLIEYLKFAKEIGEAMSLANTRIDQRH